MKANLIAGLAIFWRLIFWTWSILIAGAIAGILGNATFTYFMTGTVNFKDPRTLTIGAWLNTHLILSVTLLTPTLVLTLCSFLAHRWKQRVAQESRRVHEESFMIAAKGVQRVLDELKAKPVASLNPPSPMGVVNKETIPLKMIESTIDTFEGETDHPPPTGVEGNTHQDWGEALDVNAFFGRTKELTTLEQWIIKDHCQLVAILGLRGIGKSKLSVKLGKGGIGKTDLTLKLAQGIQDNFEYVIWRSLLNAPKATDILADLIKFLSNQKELILPDTVDGRISRLLDYLRQHQCLLILDNVEAILQGGNHAGQYREGYEGYGQMFRQIGEVPHKSCLLLTSREKTQEIATLDGKTSSVRSLELGGLNYLDAKEIFAEFGSFSGSDEEWRELNEFYNGNPLALELTAKHISEVFFGNISVFLKEDKQVFRDLRDLLDWHFERLPGLEKEIMYWLAINREPVSLAELKEDILSPIAKEQVPSTLQLLQRLLPLEKSSTRFTIQPVLIEYMTDRLVERVSEEIRIRNIDLFNSHALLKALAKDYVRESQTRLILKSINDRLLEILGNQAILEENFKLFIYTLREKTSLRPGYASGNVLNLLCQLKADLTNYDFSHLTIWQAYLQEVNLQNVNFAHVNFAKSVFIDTFGSILSVSLSPNREILAAGAASGEIRMWQATSGTPLLTLQEHTDWVRSVAFSPDGSMLASGSDDQTVRLWEVSSGRCLKVLQGHTDWVRSVTFSPDGSMFSSSGDDQTLRLWEVSTGRCLKVLQGHANRIWSVAFSPDGSTLASGSDDQTVRLWEVNTGRCLKVLQGHTDWVRSVTFSPDRSTLASGSEDQTVRLWEVSTGRCLKVLQGHTNRIWSVAFSSDGSTLASGSEDQTVRLWEVSSGHGLKVLQGYSNWVRSVAFSPDGSMLASGSDDQTVPIWEVSTGRCLKVLQGHTNRIWSVAFSPDGSTLASGSDDQTVRLWEVNTGRCLKVLQGHNNWVRSVAFSSDRSTLASGSEDQTVRLWKVSTGRCLRELQGHTNLVRSVAFSSDGKMLASSGDDQTVRLWEVSTGRCLKILQGHANLVRSVAFSPDGKILVSGGDDQAVRLWEVSTGRCLKVLHGHNSWVWSVAFSPNKSIIASGSADGTIKLWDIQTDACFLTLRSARPYELMNITDVSGLTEAQKATLRELGAIEDR